MAFKKKKSISEQVSWDTWCVCVCLRTRMCEFCDFVCVLDQNTQQNPLDQSGFEELLRPMNWTPCLALSLSHFTVSSSPHPSVSCCLPPTFFFSACVSLNRFLILPLSSRHLSIIFHSFYLAQLLFLTFSSFLPSLLILFHPCLHLPWSPRIAPSFRVFSLNTLFTRCYCVRVCQSIFETERACVSANMSTLRCLRMCVCLHLPHCVYICVCSDYGKPFLIFILAFF